MFSSMEKYFGHSVPDILPGLLFHKIYHVNLNSITLIIEFTQILRNS